MQRIKMKDTIKKAFPYLLIAIFALFYYVLNIRMGVYQQDDVWYATNLITGEPVGSFADIIEGQIWHYMNWGGRTPAHSILQLFFWIGDDFIDVFNVFACLGYVYLLNSFVRKRSVWTFLALESMIFVFNTIWVDSLLWQTGIANYLYISCFNMSFLLLYIKSYEAKEYKRRWWMHFIILPLGLIAGWSNENVGPALFLAAVCLIVIMFVQKRKVPIWMITGALSCLAGSILLIKAPGNYLRKQEVVAQLMIAENKRIIYGIFELVFSTLKYFLPLLLTVILVTVIYLKYAKLKITTREYVLLGLAFVSWGAMALSPHFPQRATFGSMCFFLCYLTEISSQIVSKLPESRKAVRWGVLFLWVMNMYLFAVQWTLPTKVM